MCDITNIRLRIQYYECKIQEIIYNLHFKSNLLHVLCMEKQSSCSICIRWSMIGVKLNWTKIQIKLRLTWKMLMLPYGSEILRGLLSNKNIRIQTPIFFVWPPFPLQYSIFVRKRGVFRKVFLGFRKDIHSQLNRGKSSIHWLLAHGWRRWN